MRHVISTDLRQLVVAAADRFDPVVAVVVCVRARAALGLAAAWPPERRRDRERAEPLGERRRQLHLCG